ncbi:hypothetical protein N9Y48_00620 [Zobellia sp.]|nr:hypothetical protein [Zobellia sp.]
MKTTIKILAVLLIAITNFSFSQSIEPSGRTYSVRLLTLKSGVNTQEFEKYAREQLVSVFRQVPGGEARVAKADRGTDKGVYVLIYFFDSKATRDYYYPIPNGEPSKAGLEMHVKIEKAILGLYEFVDQEVTEVDYTDYVFIE